MSKIKIAIDAGHGSTTAGKRTSPFKKNVDIDKDGKIDVKKGEQYREHYANTAIANLVYVELIKRGYDVIKTGWNDANSKDDSDESLTSRQRKIKNYGCDYTISIHFNASGGDGMKFNSAKGVGIYIHDKYAEDSKSMATYILKKLVLGSEQVNRGISGQSLSLCNCRTMNTKASILLELAFMTNEYEAQELMANSKFWKETTKEIADGLDEYVASKITKYNKPLKTVTKYSCENDVKWLQSNLNKYLKGVKGFIPLVVDGGYGGKTQDAMKLYWKQLKWNQDGLDDGSRAGKSTINALDSGRVK